MGKRGPAKTPTELAIVRGHRKDRINQNEPQPQERAVTYPSWLPPEAKTIWRRLAPMLRDRNVLRSWDRETFAVFCAEVARYRDALEEIARNGQIMAVERTRFSRNGGGLGTETSMVKNPAVAIAKDAAASIRQYAREFGLTPSARAELTAAGAGEPGGQDGNRLLA